MENIPQPENKKEDPTVEAFLSKDKLLALIIMNGWRTVSTEENATVGEGADGKNLTDFLPSLRARIAEFRMQNNGSPLTMDDLFELGVKLAREEIAGQKS